MPNIYLMVLKELLVELKGLADTKAGLAMVVFICCAVWFMAWNEQVDKQQTRMLEAFEKANDKVVKAIEDSAVTVRHEISALRIPGGS